ncbi:GDSL-type esterase/lipase family protein [Parafrankia sp. EUN1f]|uniref:GDSL-type esterase/lipase family protein n=1 Tax=Parafrankia sp. EUN1f TaxID=102897 RepID=UPI0001C46BB2|nr:GDSL-type esterase/lipase family protein [Parafrankia sp. EUN1f]EFC82668.1 lipolytic protein G-D-S-L family [Parafrankia sp. EUN1f]
MSRFRRVLEPGPDARMGRRARLAVAALGAVIVLGGGIGLAVSLTGADGSAQSAARTRVLILGDSVTQQTAGDYTWRYRLAQHLNLSAPGAVDFVGDRIDVWDNTADKPGSNDYVDAWFDRDHHAVWGDSTRKERDAVEGLLRATPADVLIVALGANDLTYSSSPQQAADDMLALINNARRVNPDIDVVVAQVLDRSDYVGGRDLQAQATAYNTVLDQQVGNWQTPTSSVVVARTYQDWDPYRYTWDGSHPNPAGEYVIARGVANALAQLGIGATFGPLYGDLPWPATGSAVTVDGQPGQLALSWAATPGATAYLVERRVLSRGEQEFQRQPGSLPAKPGTNTWTTDTLPAGTIAEYRIVPVKGTMTGQPGSPGRATTR